MHCIKPSIPLELFRISTNSYAASFAIKACLEKTNSIF